MKIYTVLLCLLLIAVTVSPQEQTGPGKASSFLKINGLVGTNIQTQGIPELLYDLKF